MNLSTHCNRTDKQTSFSKTVIFVRCYKSLLCMLVIHRGEFEYNSKGRGHSKSRAKACSNDYLKAEFTPANVTVCNSSRDSAPFESSAINTISMFG